MANIFEARRRNAGYCLPVTGLGVSNEGRFKIESRQGEGWCSVIGALGRRITSIPEGLSLIVQNVRRGKVDRLLGSGHRFLAKKSLVCSRDSYFAFGRMLLENVGTKGRRQVHYQVGNLHAMVRIGRGPVAKLVACQAAFLASLRKSGLSAGKIMDLIYLIGLNGEECEVMKVPARRWEEQKGVDKIRAG